MNHFNLIVEKINRHIEATRHKMPKYFRDSRIEYELQSGASNELCSRACAQSLGFLMGYMNAVADDVRLPQHLMLQQVVGRSGT